MGGKAVMSEVIDSRQAAINAAMRPWTDKEIARFSFRRGLFIRRGVSMDRAELLADTLALRDQQHDDRRMCIECSNLQRDGGCLAVRQGWISKTDKRHTPVQDVLQRCEGFQWSKPA